MAFKKAKTIESAQKLAAQGKLKEAINEYLKLYKEDPQDQTVLNTLGDLHVRLNRTSEGLTYFTKLADLYVSGGFLVRGIAMFKKITKLDPNNTRAVERLAELYTMQGLMTEARAQYLHLAEFHLKSGQVSRAVEVMQKLLDLEPDNIKLQRRLAELYRQHGQNPEAAAIYRRLGTRALQRGEADDGLEWITQAVALVPKDPETLLLQARAQLKAGQAAEALATLEKIPGVEENPEAVEILVAAQLAAGHTEDATALAEKLFSAGSTQYGGLLQLAQHAVQQNQPEQALEILQRVAEPALQRDPASFLTAVRPVVSARPDSPEANQLLLEAGRKCSDQSACVEALNRMAQTALRAEDFPRAKDLYNELVRLEPDNLEFTQQLTQLREQLGEAPAIETPVAEELGVAAPAPAPPAGELDEETQAFVDASLTDIDLFSSYGMTDKAIELAEQVIARAPGHTVANEKLLDFYLGNGNDRGVVEVATRLARLHRNHNNAERAEEVTELAKRYAEKLGMVLPTEAPVQQAAETPVETPEQTPEAVVQEVDLTAEWGSSLEEETATFNAAEAVEEISFFLKQGMVEEARSTVDGYERDFPNEPALADLRARIEAAAPAEAPQEEPAQEVAAAEETTAPAQETEEGYEVVLEEQPSEPEPAATGSMKAQDFFSDMATDIEQGLGQRED
ncbi:MAG: tetratricopeptide repeat protein, partial [Acidobacteria bacterium]|nr:tetratricopeptide repeat protein [Acidobacteriota bacterium]